MRYAARRAIDLPRAPAPIEAAPPPEPTRAAPSAIEAALAAEWPAPEPIRAAPPTFEILAVERIEPAPMREETTPTPAPVVAPEPEPAVLNAPEPAPAPERSPKPLAQIVPDVDERVDAILTAREGKPRPRRRRPLDVPRFEPLREEPWEARLDAMLKNS
jgi:hypothetical protein